MAEEYHAILLLANLMDGEGNPNVESRARADAAAQAWRQGRAPLIVPCGWAYRADTDLTIAEALSRYLQSTGIPAQAIVTETRSRDTVGDAVYTRETGAWPRPLVVTSDYHAERTRQVFAFVYGYPVTVEGAPSNAGDRLEAEQASLRAFRDTFAGVPAGDIQAIHARMLAAHPFYREGASPRV